MNHRIDAEISPAGTEVVQQAFNSIKEQMPFLTKLSDGERKGMALMDDGRRHSLKKASNWLPVTLCWIPGRD